jgi:hypothetical protein
MARSWEYSPRRRIAMQLAMWVIFGLTLALAGFVSHRRHGTDQLRLGLPIKFGDLSVRVPVGWRFSVRPADDGTLILRSTALQNGEVRTTARVRILQQRLVGPEIGAEIYLSNNVLSSGVQTSSISFPGLGRDGVVADFAVQSDPDDPTAEGPAPGIYAATIVPIEPGKSLAVLVAVEDIPPFSPDDRELLNQLVGAVKLLSQ